MDKYKQSHDEKDSPYDGAINQITPAPDRFTPQGIIDLENKDNIVVRTKPQRSQKLACFLYFCIQFVIFLGIMANCSLFNSFMDVLLWLVTVATFISYFRVCFSNPGYIEGNVIMSEEPNEHDFKEYEQCTESSKQESKDKKKSIKPSVLTKGFTKHSRFIKSNSNLKEHSRHVRTNSVGNNIMTLSNQQSIHRGYSKLQDQTFKSGDFSKMKTEIDDFDLLETNPNVTKSHHRRKTSVIKKIGTVQQYVLTDQDQKNMERDKVFNLMAERIANSRATIETENNPHSSRLSGDTNTTFHQRRKSGEDVKTEEIHFQLAGDEMKGVFKSFKDEDCVTENKQLPLASNAVTNDTDFIPGNNVGLKKLLEIRKLEEIKEENNESYDARKHIDNLEDEHNFPEFELNKKTPQQINKEVIEMKKSVKNEYNFSNPDELFKNQDTREDDHEAEDNDVNMLFVERKFCTMCSLEQPLRTKHCRKCKKCVASYDHHCPWVGNCIGEK